MDDIKLRLRRGPSTSSNFPTLLEGELAYVTDTKDLYVGTDDGNKKVGGDAIVSKVEYNKAKNTLFYCATAMENLTKATHTEGTYTASIKTKYKIDTTKATYDSESGIIKENTNDDNTNCIYWVYSLQDSMIDGIATSVDTSSEDYDFYLDNNGGYYPKEIKNTYLIKVISFANSNTYTYTADFDKNTITVTQDSDTITLNLNNYPINKEDSMWMYPLINLYNLIDYYEVVSYSDSDDDTSIQKDLNYYDGNSPYYIVHPYLNCAYLIKKTSNFRDDQNVISYKDEFSESMTDLATVHYVDKSLEESKKLEKVKTLELLSKIVNHSLIPGNKYRVTDYSISFNTDSSLGLSSKIKVTDTPHYFDIIVTAESNCSISRFASAMISDSDTSGYYNQTRIDLWKLEVLLDLDFDSNYYDSAYKLLFTSHLVITKMTDEWNNECPYDFKNIVMRRYEITADSSGAITSDMFNKGRYFTTKTSNTGWTIDTTNEYWFYTFSIIFGSDTNSNGIKDLSIEMSNGMTKGSNSLYNIFDNNKVYELFDNALNLFSCYIVSDKVNSTYPSSFTCAMFVFKDNILYSGSNTYNLPIYTNTSGTIYYSIPYSGNSFKGSKNTLITSNNISDCNIDLYDSSYISTTGIDDKYIMENSSGNIKVFNLADLV